MFILLKINFTKGWQCYNFKKYILKLKIGAKIVSSQEIYLKKYLFIKNNSTLPKERKIKKI